MKCVCGSKTVGIGSLCFVIVCVKLQHREWSELQGSGQDPFQIQFSSSLPLQMVQSMCSSSLPSLKQFSSCLFFDIISCCTKHPWCHKCSCFLDIPIWFSFWSALLSSPLVLLNLLHTFLKVPSRSVMSDTFLKVPSRCVMYDMFLKVPIRSVMYDTFLEVLQ